MDKFGFVMLKNKEITKCNLYLNSTWLVCILRKCTPKKIQLKNKNKIKVKLGEKKKLELHQHFFKINKVPVISVYLLSLRQVHYLFKIIHRDILRK